MFPLLSLVSGKPFDETSRNLSSDTCGHHDLSLRQQRCLPSRVLLCKMASTSFARFEQNDHIIARRIRRHVRNLQVGSEFRFNFVVDITNTILERSCGPFRGGVVSAFFQEQLQADATYHSWHLAQKKETESSPKSIVIHAHHRRVNDYCFSSR